MKKTMLIVDNPKTCLDCMFCRKIDEGITACCEVMSSMNESECV